MSNYINSEYVATTHCMTKLVAALLGVGFAACMPTSSTPNHGLVRPSFNALISMHQAHVQIPQGSPVAGQNREAISSPLQPYETTLSRHLLNSIEALFPECSHQQYADPKAYTTAHTASAGRFQTATRPWQPSRESQTPLSLVGRTHTTKLRFGDVFWAATGSSKTSLSVP